MEIINGSDAVGHFYLQKKGAPEICAKADMPGLGLRPVVFERSIDAMNYGVVNKDIKLSDSTVAKVEVGFFHPYERVYFLKSSDVREMLMQQPGG